MQQVKRGRYVKTLGLLAGIVGVFCLGFQASAAIEKPEQKIWRALTKLNNAHAFAYEGVITVSGPMEGAYSLYLPQTVAGSAKKSSTHEMVTIQFKGGEETFTRTESQSWMSFLFKSSDKTLPVFGMESRSVAGHTYIALSDASVLPVELEAYKNMWVQLDFKSFLQEVGLGSLLESRAAWLAPNANKDKEVIDIITKSSILKVKKTAVKKLGGVSFDVYTVVVEKKALKQLLLTLDKVLGNQVPTAAEVKSLDKELADIKSITGEIWVSKKDGYPARIDLSLAGQKPKQKSFVRINFANINQPQPVSQPASYLTIKELLDQIFPGLVSSVGKEDFKF